MKRSKNSNAPRPSRRALVKSLIAVPLMPAVSIEAAQQQPSSSEPAPVVRALLDIVRERYGKYLTSDQLDEVRKDLENVVNTGERVRARKLNNSDEPDFIFRAL